MNSDYVLNFTIPQGPTGPSGDTILKAYGYKMNPETDSTQPSFSSTFMPNKFPTAIQLPGSADKLNVNYSTNSINLLYDGLYEVKYSLLLKVPSADENSIVNVTMAIANESFYPEPISFLTIPLQDGSYHLFTYSVFLSVGNGKESNLGDKYLVIFSEQEVDFTYSTAQLSVNRIGDNS